MADTTSTPAADTTVIADTAAPAITAAPAVDTVPADTTVAQSPAAAADPAPVAPPAAAAPDAAAVVTPVVVPVAVVETPVVADAPATVTTPAVAAPVVATPVVAEVIAPVVVETVVATPVVAPVATVTPVVVATPAVSGTLVSSTTADVGAPAAPAAIVPTDAYVGTVLAGLGAETFTTDAQAVFQEILATGSSLAKNTIADVLGYVQRMGPSVPHTSQSGSAEQVALYSTLMNCINNAGGDFQLMWAIILRIVFETKDTGAFADRLCFRFFPYMAMDQGSRTTFRNLLCIMTATSNTSGRATALSQIDFQKALGQQYTDSGKNRMLAFYNI